MQLFADPIARRVQGQPGQVVGRRVEREDERGSFEFGATVEQVAANPEFVKWPGDVGVPQAEIVVRLLANILEVSHGGGELHAAMVADEGPPTASGGSLG